MAQEQKAIDLREECKAPVTRDQVLQLEDAIRAQLPPVELEHIDHFAPGIYCRELRIPAGVVLTGKIHRFETMNILAKGTIRVTTDEGVKELTAPAIFNSPPEAKKAGYAVTDVVFLNIHPTEETDVDVIEHKFIAPSFEALEKEKVECLGQQ